MKIILYIQLFNYLFLSRVWLPLSVKRYILFILYPQCRWKNSQILLYLLVLFPCILMKNVPPICTEKKRKKQPQYRMSNNRLHSHQVWTPRHSEKR